MLSDAKVKAAEAKDKPYKLGDSAQLFLYVSTTGVRSWRMNYTFGRNAQDRPQQKTLTLGTYPAMSLAEARSKRDEAKAWLKAGKDPSVERALAKKADALKAETTFKTGALRSFELNNGWSIEQLDAYRQAYGGERKPCKPHLS